MKDYESVVEVIAVADQLREIDPEGRFYVGRVDQRIEGICVDLECEFTDFRHLVKDLSEVERLQSLVRGVLFHSDCAAGVDHQQRRSVIHKSYSVIF